MSFSGYLRAGTGSVSFVEQAGTGYSAQAITLTSAALKRTTNAGAVNFSATGSNWGVITQLGFSITASSPILFWWNKSVPKTVANGATYNIGATHMNLMFSDVFYEAGLNQWRVGDNLGQTLSDAVLNVGASFVAGSGSIVPGNSVPGTGSLIAELLAANTQSTSDQAMVMYANGGYIIDSVIVLNPTGNIAALAGAVYAGPNKDGGNVVAGANATTFSSTLTAPNKFQVIPLNIVANTNIFTNPLIVSFSTAAQAAGTLDFQVRGKIVS